MDDSWCEIADHLYGHHEIMDNWPQIHPVQVVPLNVVYVSNGSFVY